jgi:ParB-like chromosome segregation protein Spo0J
MTDFSMINNATISENEGFGAYRASGSQSHGELLEASTETYWLPIDELLPADSPRLDGEDAEHTEILAESGAKLPPVIVHRQTMRIIDGTHRLGAALLRGDDIIEVRFFEGSVQEAFVVAVKANISHGRPLSLAERTSAVERIIRDHPAWSNRAIAAAVGLGTRTVNSIRQRLESGGDATLHEVKARVGRDGRVRPLDNAEGRLRAAEVIKERPEASLREIAKIAGVSPTTVRDVRNRLARGETPVPAKRPGNRNPAASDNGSTTAGNGERQAMLAMLRGLQRDPSLRFNESGRALVRWLLTHSVDRQEWFGLSNTVPSHCTYIIADIARQFADEWIGIANELEQRTEQVA